MEAIMMEPQPRPSPNDSSTGPPERADLPPPPPPDPPIVLDEDGLALAEPTDDTPTIISRNVPRPPPPEDALGASLRGRHLAHFELIEPIGVGGMGAVLRARDTQLDRSVALKVLPPDLAQDPENIRRFHQEARAAARLDHENIARVFFCGEDQRLHFIAFEFVEGDNLRTILERRGRLPVGEAIHYVLQIAAGLSHAAQRGVVHRDIKPSNIIVTPAGRAKLVDMGLARSQHPHSDNALTQSGVTLGTFDYISPEQALEPRDADVRSDIYSLGCTFYHMLTGTPPVPEGTAAKKLHHHQHVKPTDPRQLVADLPDEVVLILDRMIAKQPRDRYQTPEQLVHHLLAVARKLGTASDLPDGAVAVETSLPQQPAARPLLLAACAACAVIALIFLLGQPPPGPPRPPVHNPGKGSSPDDAAQAAIRPPPSPPDKPPPTPPENGHTGAPQPSGVPTYEEPKPDAASLNDWLVLHQSAPKIVIVLCDNLDVSTFRSGLTIRNDVVHIRGKAGQPRPKVQYTYDGNAVQNGTLCAFNITSRHSEIEGLSFVVNNNSGNVPLAAVVFQGGNHVMRNCELEQNDPYNGKPENMLHRLASVLVDGKRDDTSLELEHCAFIGFAKRTALTGVSSHVMPDPMRPMATALSALTFSPKVDTPQAAQQEGRPREAAHDAPADIGRFFGVAWNEALAQDRSADVFGQDAMTARGRARIQVSHCVFGPHAAVFRLEMAVPRSNEPTVMVHHSTMLTTDPSAVFDVAAGTHAAIKMTESLVGRVTNGGAVGGGGAAVLLQQMTREGLVRYEGTDNRYHNLDSYWTVGTVASDFSTFTRAQLPAAHGSDRSREIFQWPWKSSTPLASLERHELAAAFQLRDDLKELRVPDDSGKELPGADAVGPVRYRLTWPPIDPGRTTPVSTGRTLVVEKDHDDPSRGIYSSLPYALDQLRPGDVIELRVQGEIKVPRSMDLARKEQGNVLIRAASGYRPILVLDNDGPDKDIAFFRLTDGQLVLEDLEVRLRPSGRFDAQTVVAMLGDGGKCVLRRCIITLDPEGRETLVAVAALPDLAKSKMMPVGMPPAQPRDKGPRLELDGCFVRGKGELVNDRSGRACEIELRNSLVALNGALLQVETASDPSATAATVELRLERVTTCLTDPLVRLRGGKDVKGLPQVVCRPVDCLFVPAGSSGDRSQSALIHLEGAQNNESVVRKNKFSWEAGRNAYGPFNAMLEFLAAEEGMMAQPVKVEAWKNEYGESSSAFNVTLDTSSPDPFPQLVPTDFKPGKGVPLGCGADVTKLPTPRAPGTRP
jgi:hypothetical protein